MNKRESRRTRDDNNSKAADRQNEPSGLYVHVPFCKTKCPYCDFYSITDLSWEEAWLGALFKEINLYKDNFDVFDTLYIGGGTPTALNNAVLVSLFEELHRQFSFADDTEITVEANPDDITPKKLALLKSLGVNRLSIGIQSFNNRELGLLQRRHHRQDTMKALRSVSSAGFTNYSMDLMYGLPGQTMEGWLGTLQEALTFHPTHVSCYQLTIEQTTPFGKMLEQGSLQNCNERQGRKFFLTTSKFLEENGFVHYEISNFSRGNKFRSRHNCKYWRHIPYLGLGPGAHSFRSGTRWWNCTSVKNYCDKLKKGSRPIVESEVLSTEQLRFEKLFLGLRTCDGVTLDVAFPESPANRFIDEIIKSRLVSANGNRIIPTKKGFLMADHLPLLFP